MNIEFREVNNYQINQLYVSMRDSDMQEGIALFGTNVQTELKKTIKQSDFVRAIFIDNQLVCMIGVIKDSVGAIPWMIGTNLLDKYPIQIVRHSKQHVKNWLREYKFLHNVVDTRNTTTIKWLKHIGFTIHEAVPMGIHGLPFHPFTMNTEI